MYFLCYRNACQHQVNSYSRQKYKTLEEAEEDLHITYLNRELQGQSSEESTNPGDVTGTPQSLQGNRTPLSLVLAHSPHQACNSVDNEECFGDSVTKFIKLLASVSSHMRRDLMQNLFCQYMYLEFSHNFVPFIPPVDFLELCCKGINVL